MQQFFGWMYQVVLALALPYFAISVALSIRVATRGGLKLGSQEREEPAVEAERHDRLYFIVPCLNEEHDGSPIRAVSPKALAPLSLSGDDELA